MNSKKKRRGSIYLAVLGVAMIVSIIGMCSMQLSRLSLRAAQDRQAHSEARFLAQSAVEFGLARIDLDPNWRNSYTSGQEEPDTPLTIGNGTIAFKLVDAIDNDLSNDATQPIEIHGIGRVGNSTFVYKVDYANTAGSGEFQIVPGSWAQIPY